MSEKYDKLWQEGRMPMPPQSNENEQKVAEEKNCDEKRKNLPPLETWLNSDKTARELHEMGYSYLEMMELGSRLW